MRRVRVVLVCRSGLIRDSVRNVLDAVDYDVIPVTRMATLRNILAQPEPDLVIIENRFERFERQSLNDPGPLSKLRVSHHVKSHWPNVPILLWHSGLFEGDLPGQPVDVILTEPDRGELTKTVEQLLARATQALRVFLCHAKEDKEKVRKIYHALQADGFRPWLDDEDLSAGQNWRLTIMQQLRESHVVVVCLSRHSVGKRGYVQKEVAYALDLLEEHPEGAVYVIPLLLEDCTIPDRIAHLHVALVPFEEGVNRLRRALFARARELRLAV